MLVSSMHAITIFSLTTLMAGSAAVPTRALLSNTCMNEWGNCEILFFFLNTIAESIYFQPIAGGSKKKKRVAL